MIHEISIRNIALIDDLTISFEKGFNVLTGETGAGKSILIDSVNLALGERADRELIQTGKDHARVELLFSMVTGKANEILKSYGIEPESDGTMLLMRELTVQGRNICRINGHSVTLSMLRSVSRHLVDVHGQHQHQSLLSAESHIDYLDRLGGDELASQKEDFQKAWHSWKLIQKEINKIINRNKDGETRKDFLKYQIDEIEQASLKPGEEEELRKEREVLIHAEKIIQAVTDAYQQLYSGENVAPSITDQLGKVLDQLHTVEAFDESLGPVLHPLENIQYSLEDVILNLRAYKERFEFDPLRLENIETRLGEIQDVKRKYHGTAEEVLERKKQMESELEEIEESHGRLESLQKNYQSTYQTVLAKCRKLSHTRMRCAKFLESGLARQLADLNMEKTQFRVSFTTPDPTSLATPDPTSLVTPDAADITENGYDKVEFQISTNPGEPLKPLAKIVSGGEMSRVMLAFKTILGNLDEIPTMIFDEIDVGIGGRTAQSVAEKIRAISKSRQVICVTHLPQIASMADGHYVIEKKVTGNHTRTLVSRLGPEDRKKEIARMIGGSSLTPLSLQHAGELIASASQPKNS